MEISDYITDCMTVENSRDFLEMQGEKLKEFKPVLLRTTKYSKKGSPLDAALQDLAKQAIDSGCKYVANINGLGYSTPSTKLGGYLWSAPIGEFFSGVLLAGTGLVPKKK